MEISHPSAGVRAGRHFVSPDLEIKNTDSLFNYFDDLLNREFYTIHDLERWLLDRSELAAILEEDLAWRYIYMNCDTADEKLAKRFEKFVTKIEPELTKQFNLLDRKFMDSPFSDQLDEKKYHVFKRTLKSRVEIFREKNLPLIATLQVEEQKYGKISSEMTITHKRKKITLQEATNFLKDPHREIREKFYFQINDRRLEDAEALQDLLTSLIDKRQQLAVNAGFENYRGYKWIELGRFDYSPEDCFRFHDSIATQVCPLVDQIAEQRKVKLGLDKLRPWDMEVDQDLKSPLKPFEKVNELIDKSIESFGRIRPVYGKYLKTMKEGGFLDLDSRIGKAPGGFNYPLYESNIPFIYMNATGNLRDLETMFHEGGHAIHSFLSAGQKLVEYKELPAEVAELASMSMELISMDQWGTFFTNKEELARAKRSQLEGILQVLPWIAAVDKFQHWLYTNKNHSGEERNLEWKNIMREFGSKVTNWEGIEKYRDFMWQKQLHIYEVPFYYIEYGMAQLGAIAVWKKYRENPVKALNQYEKALSLGYSVPISEVYQTAGIPFDFSKEYVNELMAFVAEELRKID
jgi:oligoendopeptidase F